MSLYLFSNESLLQVHRSSINLEIFKLILAFRRLRKICPYLELFWSAFFLHFPAFGLNTERYGVSLRIQSEYGKMWEKCGLE